MGLASASPALRLLVEYVRRAEGPSADSQAFKGRMKLMMKVPDDEYHTLGLPNMCESFNGKPTLLTKSSTIVSGPGYFEVDVNLRVWAFAARKYIHSMWSTIPKLNIMMCCTVEARTDDEMNEIALGCCT